MSLQTHLPLAIRQGPGQLFAHGVLVDFNEGTLSPSSLASIECLLAVIDRYGVMRSLRSERCCSVLFHSVLVGRMARRLVECGHVHDSGLVLDVAGPRSVARDWADEVILDLLGMYGALHDCGEIFGGDMPNVVPPQVAAAFKAYQSSIQVRLIASLGLPRPSNAISKVVKMADKLSVLAEYQLQGAPYPTWALDGLSMELWRAGLVNLDPMAFAQAELSELGLSDRFPRVNRVRSLWRKLVQVKALLLSSSPGPSELSVLKVASSLNEGPRTGGANFAGESLHVWALESGASPGGSVHELPALASLGRAHRTIIEVAA